MPDRPVLDVQQRWSPDLPQLAAFDEVAIALHDGLQRAGVDSELRRGTELGDRPRVLFGTHTLEDEQIRALPADTILYAFEQIGKWAPLSPKRLPAFAGHPVWDFARRNLRFWADAGISAAHVPLGWSPALRRLDRTVERDVDVLFYGTPHPRRDEVLDALRDRGLRVESLAGVFAEERDRWIERSRVVLNVGFFPQPVLETVRLAYLFTNGVPVVSELDDDVEVPPGLERGARYAPYDDLVDATVDLLADDAALQNLSVRSVEAIRGQPWRFPTSIFT